MNAAQGTPSLSTMKMWSQSCWSARRAPWPLSRWKGGMSVLHDVSTQDFTHTLARSIGPVGFAREGSGGHDDSTGPVSRPF